MSAQITLNARNLSRRLGSREVIHNISLQLRRGEVLGLLGHNGAGKSTTMQLLAGVLIPHSGQIEICGIDLALEPARAKACIGYLPETPPLYRDMRVDDFLIYAARLHRVPRTKIAEALSAAKGRCGLQDAGRKIIGSLSKGYQQRVGIAQAIIHQPEVVILDEPTVGLDPRSARLIKDMLRQMAERGAAVFLSTHILEIAERMCDRIGIINNGELIAIGSMEELRALGKGETSLEDIFLTLTGGAEDAEIAEVLK